MALSEGDRGEIEGYLRRLIWALQSLPKDDRVGITGEIESHLVESAERGGQALRSAFAGLGHPSVLARSFIEEFELSGAVNRAMPGTLLVNMLSRGSRSIAAFSAGTAALLLYVVAFALLVVAAAKPIAPRLVGAWQVDGHLRSAGFLAGGGPAGGVEILGYWIIPIAVGVAVVAYAAATRLLRDVAGRLLMRTGVDPAGRKPGN